MAKQMTQAQKISKIAIRMAQDVNAYFALFHKETPGTSLYDIFYAKWDITSELLMMYCDTFKIDRDALLDNPLTQYEG